MRAGSEAHAEAAQHRRSGDPAAAEDLVAVVEHRRLAGRHGPDRRRRSSRSSSRSPAVAGARSRRPGSRGAGSGRRAERRGRRAVPATNDARSSSTVRVSRSSRRPSWIVLVSGVDAADVARLTEGDAEALALADRVPRRAPVLAHPLAADVEQRPRLRLPAGALAQRVAVVAARDEADLLALGLVGRRQAEAAGDVAHLGLGELAEREPGVRPAGPGAARTGSRSGPCPRRERGSSRRAAVGGRPRGARSGRSRPPRTRTGAGPGRAAPRTSRTVLQSTHGLGVRPSR